MKSRILLCCLTPFTDPQSIDEFLIYQIFKKHSIVKNIKVFNRDSIVKAFVLVEDELSVKKAIEALNNTTLNIGKLKVFLSHKPYIAFSRTLKEIIQTSYSKGEQDDQTLLLDMNSSFKNIEFLVSEKTKRVDDSLETEKKLHSFLTDNKKQESSFEEDEGFKRPVFNKVVNYKDLLLNKNDKTKGELSGEFSMMNLKRPYPQKQKTTMVRVNGINGKKVTFVHILNFFGCFGNVKRLLTNLKENYSILDFETPNQARLVVRHVPDTLFFGSLLKAEYWCDEDVFDSVMQEPKSYIKTRINRPKFFRYKKNLNIKINKATKILHFTNLPDKITPVVLYQLVGQIKDPINIFKLAKRGTSSDMFLVEFESVSDSIEVLSVLHNMKIDGKLMKVSFSHTEVEKSS